MIRHVQLSLLKTCKAPKPIVDPQPLMKKLQKARKSKNAAQKHAAAMDFFSNMLPGPVVLPASLPSTKKAARGPLIGGNPAVFTDVKKPAATEPKIDTPHRISLPPQENRPLIGGEPEVYAGGVRPHHGHKKGEHDGKPHRVEHHKKGHHEGKPQHHGHGNKKHPSWDAEVEHYWKVEETKVHGFLKRMPWVMPVALAVIGLMVIATTLAVVVQRRRRARHLMQEDRANLIVEVPEKSSMMKEQPQPSFYVNEIHA